MAFSLPSSLQWHHSMDWLLLQTPQEEGQTGLPISTSSDRKAKSTQAKQPVLQEGGEGWWLMAYLSFLPFITTPTPAHSMVPQTKDAGSKRGFGSHRGSAGEREQI